MSKIFPLHLNTFAICFIYMSDLTYKDGPRTQRVKLTCIPFLRNAYTGMLYNDSHAWYGTV